MVSEKQGDFGSIMAFLGAKRVILGSLHREGRQEGSRVESREVLTMPILGLKMLFYALKMAISGK
jgi:hypothetical protein